MTLNIKKNEKNHLGDEYVIVGQKDDGESFIGLMNQLLAKMSDFPKNMMEIIH